MYLNYEESLIEELELGLNKLNSVTEQDPESIIDQIDTIIAKAQITGICKDDGEKLQAFGVISQELTDRLTEYRSPVGLDEVGIEIDKENLLGKLAMMAIGALSVVITFILYKLFKFIMGLFDSDKLPESGGMAKPDIGKALVKVVKTDASKDDMESALEKVFQGIKTGAVITFFDEKDRQTYPMLNYPKWALDLTWVNNAFKALKSGVAAVEGTTEQGTVDYDNVLRWVEELKTTPRNELKTLVGEFESKLEEMFESPVLSKDDEALNEQLQFFRRWSTGTSWLSKTRSDMMTSKMEDVLSLNKKSLDLAEKAAEDLEKDLKDLEKNLKLIKVNDRRVRQAAKTYLRLSCTDPTKCMTAITQRLVLPYLVSAGKLSVKFNTSVLQASDIIAEIVNYVCKDSDDLFDLTHFNNLGDEFGRVYKEGKVLPKRLHKYELVAKEASKLKDLTSLTIEIIKTNITGSK